MKMNNKKPIIGIVGGTGKMGQWLKAFFEKEGYPVLIAGRSTPLTPAALVKKSNIVIVSVPISVTEGVIRTIVPLLRKDMLLTDVTSVKVMPLTAMRGALGATLGMHPLFAPSTALPHGLKVVFCRQKDNDYVGVLQTLLTKNGIEVVEMSAEEHDYHMAYIQALTHAINLLYAKVIFDQKDAVSSKIATPISMLQSLIMGRVLVQDMGLLADIELYNPYFSALLENLAANTKDLLTIIQKGNKEDFFKLFRNEKLHGSQYAQFSTMQTNKILRLVSEVESPFPQKIGAARRRLAHNATISYLGPQGTHSHEAVLQLFPKASHKKIPCKTLYKIFESVEEGVALIGVVPAENSTEGSVQGTLDYLVEFQLFVNGSFDLPIQHHLLSVDKKLDSIRVVVSHPQALAQCKRWLATNLPHAKQVPSPSTAEGIRKKKGYAYIASATAAKKYTTPILVKNIGDYSSNTTRFYFIAKKQISIHGVSIGRTLLFLTVYNRVGILRDILNVFADNGINLTKLESRPSYDKAWDYHFFVEVEREYNNPSLEKALSQLKSYCPVIRMLGRT